MAPTNQQVRIDVHPYWPHGVVLMLILAMLMIGFALGSFACEWHANRQPRMSRQQRKNDRLIHSVSQVFADAGMKMHDAASRRGGER